MIDYSDRGVCGLIFSWTGSTLSRTWPECILSMIFTAIFVAVIDLMDGWTVMDWYSKMGHDLLIMPLAFLLVYRTGMAYNRFFEGRGHVGKMVLSARELARGITTYVKGDDPITKQNQANVARLVRAYTIALRLSLRKMESNPESVKELEAVLTKAEMAKITAVKKNFVLVIVKWIGDEVMKFKGQLLFDRATDFMEKSVSDLMLAWMGMHKLATTPMPFPYVQMLYFLLYGWMYTIGTAMSMKAEIRYKAIPAAGLLAFALFGINAIGQELEDPFGEEINDLPLEFFEGAANAGFKVMVGQELKPEVLEPGVGAPPMGRAMGGGSAQQQPGQSFGGITRSAPIDVQAVINDPGFEAKVKAEVKTATQLNQLSPELQVVFQAYFDRYDLNANQILDNPKELTQLVTNLAFALKLGPALTKLLEQVDLVEPGFSWPSEIFVAWFLKQAKTI